MQLVDNKKQKQKSHTILRKGISRTKEHDEIKLIITAKIKKKKMTNKFRKELITDEEKREKDQNRVQCMLIRSRGQLTSLFYF